MGTGEMSTGAYAANDGSRTDFVFNGYDANSGYTLRPIRQYGKDLVYADNTSEKVTLHGVMDTPNAYFNNNRWAITNWNTRYDNDGDVTNCLAYFETLLSAFTNHEAGSYVDLFRLHLDPAWTNDPAITAVNGGGENDISRFSADRLRTYMKKLYWPIAKKAIDKGMYVIMRPPGVCPETISVGGEYQQYLMTVWDIVSSDENIKKYAGMIMIELANEPITVKDASGNAYDWMGKKYMNVLHDFFQPIVDKIRSNGFKGVILSSGSGYQWHYEGYEQYPITGDNIGYAVHWYPGWHGTKSTKEAISDQTVIDAFRSDVPVVTSRPVVITEVDWSPEDASGTIDHYNEFNQPVYKNYGTWATGWTSYFGKNFKATHDHFGNISMTLTHPYEYVDFDQLFNNGKVTYSYQGKTECKEACAYTCFADWYPKLYKDHTPGGTSPAPEITGGDTPGETPLPFALGRELSWEEVKDGNTAFVLVSGSNAMYGTDDQNTGFDDAISNISKQNTVSVWKAETASNGFLFRGYNLEGTAYSLWGYDGYLNAQSSQTGVTFILGKNDFSNGQDMDNGAVWSVMPTTGGYHIRNVGNGAYLDGTNTSVSADKVWKFYTVYEQGIKVTTTGAKTNAWDSQIRFPLPDPLQEGVQYTIEMVVKADAAVDIQPIAADNDSENKDQWGGTADVQYLSVSVTDQWSTVSFMTNGNYPYDYLYFNIGKVNGNLMIYSIKITDSAGNVFFDANASGYNTWEKVQSDLKLTTSPFVCDAGDVNNDSKITIADLSVLIDMLKGNRVNGQADVNADGEVNKADVTKLVELILSGK